MALLQNTPDSIFNYIYNICFRLVGNHLVTVELVKKAYQNSSSAQNQVALIKALCKSYNSWHSSPAIGCGKPEGPLLQQALLQLSPQERLVVVLRDVAGLNYDTIASVTGNSRQEVAGLLASGRWALRDKLIKARPDVEVKPEGVKISAG